MDRKTLELIKGYSEAIIRLLVLWSIKKTFYGNEKRMPFDFRVFDSELGIGNFTKVMEVINELVKEEIIEIGDFDGDGQPVQNESGEYGRIFRVRIPKGKNIDEIFSMELNSFDIPREHYSLDKQMTELTKYLTEKTYKFGKREITFDWKDYFLDWAYMNVFFTILHLEEDGVLEIDSLEIVCTPMSIEDKRFLLNSFKFNIVVGNHTIKGDSYTIDLKEAVIRFEDPEREILLSRNTEAYRLFKAFGELTVRKLHYKAYVDLVTKGFNPYKNDEDLKDCVKHSINRIRSNCLGTKKGGDFDILINKNFWVSLRGVE